MKRTTLILQLLYLLTSMNTSKSGFYTTKEGKLRRYGTLRRALSTNVLGNNTSASPNKANHANNIHFDPNSAVVQKPITVEPITIQSITDTQLDDIIWSDVDSLQQNKTKIPKYVYHGVQQRWKSNKVDINGGVCGIPSFGIFYLNKNRYCS